MRNNVGREQEKGSWIRDSGFGIRIRLWPNMAMGIWGLGVVSVLRDRASSATEPLPRDGGVRGWRMARSVYVARDPRDARC
eukprot:scaffold6300_cov23-Tisochrysis_lutea.AAC.2